mmetsp:Transcript_2543/g.6717  ORF Transcript_2543/g.6717 Transcript_2543/m.6717 type:complete len:393 (+) Transcript_2543:1178-2356(+)
MARASGGCWLEPKDLNQALQLFERENMLETKTRTTRYIKTGAFGSVDELTKMVKTNPKPDETESLAVPLGLQNPNQTEFVVLPSTILSQANTILAANVTGMGPMGPTAASPGSPGPAGGHGGAGGAVGSVANPARRMKRIINELQNVEENPHRKIHVFPCRDDLNYWRVVIQGPTDTPYSGGLFLLWVAFPPDYPAAPPLVRFAQDLTRIIHVNINPDGKVCHPILDRSYSMQTRLQEILTMVYALLFNPEPKDPLDSFLANMYWTNQQEFYEYARRVTRDKCSLSFEEMLPRIMDPAAYDQWQRETPYRCPLTHHFFKDPVRTPDGMTYEREAIKEHIESNGPFDPFIDNPLYEENLEADVRKKQQVVEYITSNCPFLDLNSRYAHTHAHT